MRRLAAAAVLVLSACTGVPEAEPFLGVWASQGWGLILHVHGGDADVYETSATHCLLTSEGSARNIDEVAALEGDELVLRDSGRVIRFDRRDALPVECTLPADATAPAVFAAAVAAVTEHYHPGVDDGWEDRVATLSPDAAADDASLFAALTELLTPLQDPVFALQRADGEVWSPPLSAAVTALRAAQLDDSVLPGAVITAGEGIVIGEVAPGIGYLGLLRLGGFAANSAGSQRVLAAALDQTLRDHDAVVLDLRTATTGSELEALLVATRFVLAPTVVATSAVRVPGGDAVAAGESIVNPMPTGPFPGRVVVLIGPGTSGPAELLALALEPLAAVTLVGEPSAGSPRVPLVRTLPNGWILGVPHSEVFATGGTGRVGNPLVPDVIAVVTVADLTSGRDPGIAAALEVLAV